MTNDQILELEIALLLLKYDSEKIIKLLAKLNNLTKEDLEIRLKQVHRMPKKVGQGKRSRTSKLIDEINNQHPENRDILNLLYSKFQAKSFLPSLHDVRRLFHRHSLDVDKLKSRESAAIKVFTLLAGFNQKELEDLAQEADKTNFSSLGVISDEILKRKA
jgi:hypothetical protein